MSTLQIDPLYICIHIPEFPAQARLRLQPELLHSPAAVLDGEHPLEQVCSANKQALVHGVTRGMTRTELAGFTGLTVLRRSLEEERSTRNALLSMTSAFTPRVQVCPASSVSALLLVLDMTGTQRMFGPPPQAAKAISQAVEVLNLHARIAVSGNFQAAVCASAFARKVPFVLPFGKERQTMQGLPLSALSLTEEQRNTFALWGIRTLGELADLPETELVVRLGQEGKRLRQLARGEHPHFMVPEEPVFTLEEQMVLDDPEERLDSLLFVLGPMFDQLLRRAQIHAFALASVTLKLVLDGCGEHIRTLKPALPLSERAVLLKLVQLDLQAHPPAAGVLAIHVLAEPGERSKVQTGLFSPPLPEPMRLDVTLARIAALVGEDRVGRARLQDTHAPEAFAMERFVVPQSAPQKQIVKSRMARRCLRPPVPLHMRSPLDTPASFFYGGKHFTIAEIFGPWRRSGEWWSDSVWSREEWDIHATAKDGETLLCVVFQDLLQKSWHLEALYD